MSNEVRQSLTLLLYLIASISLYLGLGFVAVRLLG